MASGKLPAPDSPPTPGAALDEPPSYDYVTEASSSNQVATLPDHIQHLFVDPPNAEPLLGRATTPQSVLDGIQTVTRGLKVESHDSKLEDATVLYDFIRSQVLARPGGLKLRCIGSHWETPARDETVTDNGGTRQRRKGQAELVVDFNFTIDLSSIYTPVDNLKNTTLTTVPADIPAYRGSHRMTYSAAFARDEALTDRAVSSPGKVASDAMVSLRGQWKKYQVLKGILPWVNMWTYKPFWDSRSGSGLVLYDEQSGGLEEEERGLVNAEPAGLKSWCERYTADGGWLKEFHVEYLHPGWDLEGLTTAVKGAIASTGYQSNNLTVDFQPDCSGLVVKPPNLLSRAIGSKFVRALLWILLIYPFIWVWQRMSQNGGAPYKVTTATFSLKSYQPLPTTYPSETLSQAQNRLPGLYKTHPEIPKGASLQAGPKGVYYLLGRKEGEWFREWEERIRMGVRMRFVGELQGGGEEEAGTGLDGY